MTTEKTTAVDTRQETALPAPVARRGLDEFSWRALKNSVFPGARNDSILMAVDYCRARGLDVLKKPVHIVPMKVKDAQTGEEGWRDVIMPGIYETRTTAQKTGEYLGQSRPEYGDNIAHLGVTAPEWCELTVYRWNAMASMRAEYTTRVYFTECVGTTGYGDKLRVNTRWTKAPIQMLTKCAEAAALRMAFPDEIGGEMTAEEMDGQRQIIDIRPAEATPGATQTERLKNALSEPELPAAEDREPGCDDEPIEHEEDAA